MYKILIFGLSLLFFPFSGLAQTEEIHDDDSHKAHGHHNRLALFTGTSLVPTHLSTGEDKTLYGPTYGIEYERIVSSRLAFGVMNEIELQNYVIENAEGESINRSYIYVLSVVVMFRPVKNLVLFAGPGYELTSDHNFGIIKVGMLYPFKLTREWDISPEIAVDQVSNLYTTFTFGITIGKKF